VRHGLYLNTVTEVTVSQTPSHVTGSAFALLCQAATQQYSTSQSRVKMPLHHYATTPHQTGNMLSQSRLWSSTSKQLLSVCHIFLHLLLLTQSYGTVFPMTLHLLLIISVLMKTENIFILAVICGLSLYKIYIVHKFKQARVRGARYGYYNVACLWLF